MNWPSARSSRANCPFSTVKREPESLAAALEIHHAERFADLEMLPHPVWPRADLADLAGFDIVMLVLAEGNILQRHVREVGECVVEVLVQPTLFGFAILDQRLDLADLRLQAVGQSGILGSHRLADFLRGGVAALLCLLQFQDMRPARLILGNESFNRRLRIGIGPRALLQRIGKGLGVLANPLDVKHGRTILTEAQRA